MMKRLGILCSTVFLVAAVASASVEWLPDYTGVWSDPSWFDSGSSTYINHPGGTEDTRIKTGQVTLDVTDGSAGLLFVGRGGGATPGVLVLDSDTDYLQVGKGSTELVSAGYDGAGGSILHSAGTLKVARTDTGVTGEVRLSHATDIPGVYELSGTGLLDVQVLNKGDKTRPGEFNASGGTLAVRTKIYKFGLVSETYGFSLGGALLAPGGVGEVGTITNGDSSNKQDFLTTSSSTLEFDIASASSFDKIVSYGAFDLDTCSIKVNLLGGYTPEAGAYFDVFTTIGGDPTYGGTGTPTILTGGWTYEWKDVNDDGKMDTLRLPEPATLSVLALGLSGLLIRRRRS